MGWAGYFLGDVRVAGILSKIVNAAFVKNQSGVEKLLYAEESTENWFATYGEGQLVNGSATITIEPEFLSTINTSVPYRVFVQMEGPCNNAGAYVTNKTTTTFDVVQQNTGSNCNSSFSYRIVAKRNGFENLYMGTPGQTSVLAHQYIQNNFPEILTEAAQIEADADAHNETLLPEGYTFTNPPALTHIQPTQPRVLTTNPTKDLVLPPR
ncbi:MAG TPA: hypothetical protein VI757_10615 [Bacteroidia bacterium]|nr:hypothetical protein [Bacteroidia bacterium]